MFDQDLSKFAALLVGVGEVYGKSFTSAMIEIYWRILKDFEFEEVKKAIHRHLENPDTGRFLPKPADIIMAIEGNSESQSLLAWSKVCAAIYKIGIYTSVAFDDALIHRVIEDMGGWQRLCKTKSEELPFVAKEFQKRYQGYVIKKPASHPKYFSGLIEQQNSVYGYVQESPTLIGDPTKARQVIASGKEQNISLTKESFLENKLTTSNWKRFLTK